ICGFVVPSDMFDTAVKVIEQAGLSSCNCTSPFHFADPIDPTWLPNHFRVAQSYGLDMTLFLCPSDRLLNLIPLYPSHPNPLALRYNLIAVHLYEHHRQVILLLPGMEVPPDYYAVKALATTSLIELLILLGAFLSPFDGVGRQITDLLHLFALASRDQAPYVLQSPSLQRLWDIYYVRMKRSKTDVLWDNVKLEWRNKLSL
ncbi:hypothetical protein C0995_007827, partial [Termitomyces sp. Mi166